MGAQASQLFTLVNNRDAGRFRRSLCAMTEARPRQAGDWSVFRLEENLIRRSYAVGRR